MDEFELINPRNLKKLSKKYERYFLLFLVIFFFGVGVYKGVINSRNEVNVSLFHLLFEGLSGGLFTVILFGFIMLPVYLLIKLISKVLILPQPQKCTLNRSSREITVFYEGYAQPERIVIDGHTKITCLKSGDKVKKITIKKDKYKLHIQYFNDMELLLQELRKCVSEDSIVMHSLISNILNLYSLGFFIPAISFYILVFNGIKISLIYLYFYLVLFCLIARPMSNVYGEKYRRFDYVVVGILLIHVVLVLIPWK